MLRGGNQIDSQPANQPAVSPTFANLRRDFIATRFLPNSQEPLAGMPWYPSRSTEQERVEGGVTRAARTRNCTAKGRLC